MQGKNGIALPGLAAMWFSDYFGHHPANRFALTAGRDLVVSRAPARSPVIAFCNAVQAGRAQGRCTPRV